MKSMSGVIAIAMVLGASSAASAAMVRRAGEWETRIDGGQPIFACATHDASFDNKTITKMMGQIPNAHCSMPNINTLGPITTFKMECDVYGNHMVSSGTTAQTGFDSFTTKSHTHVDGGKMKLPNGQSFPMPDEDMTTVSNRTGACKPGDRAMSD